MCQYGSYPSLCHSRAIYHPYSLHLSSFFPLTITSCISHLSIPRLIFNTSPFCLPLRIPSFSHPFPYPPHLPFLTFSLPLPTSPLFHLLSPSHYMYIPSFSSPLPLSTEFHFPHFLPHIVFHTSSPSSYRILSSSPHPPPTTPTTSHIPHLLSTTFHLPYLISPSVLHSTFSIGAIAGIVIGTLSTVFLILGALTIVFVFILYHRTRHVSGVREEG